MAQHLFFFLLNNKLVPWTGENIPFYFLNICVHTSIFSLNTDSSLNIWGSSVLENPVRAQSSLEADNGIYFSRVDWGRVTTLPPSQVAF